jgi:hypothetical protein
MARAQQPNRMRRIGGLIDVAADDPQSSVAAEIDLCLDEAREASGGPCGPEDVVPAYTAQAVSRPGDLWALGPHLLLCGDVRSPEAYGQLLGDMKAEFVFTDPPYNVPIDGHVCGLGRIRHRSFAMGCGESSGQFAGFLTTIFEQLVAHTTDGSIHQVCMDWRHMAEMLQAGHGYGGGLKQLCVWNKGNAGMGSFYRSKQARHHPHPVLFAAGARAHGAGVRDPAEAVAAVANSPFGSTGGPSPLVSCGSPLAPPATATRRL